MKFSRLFLISLLAVLTLVLVQLPGSTLGWSGNPIVATSWTGNPIVATTPIPGITLKVVASPNKPSTLASYTFEFQVPNELVNGVDEIIITWDKDFKNFPSVIANSTVSVRASAVTNSPPGTPNQAVAPEEVNVDFVTPQSADVQPQTKIRIPDMDTDEGSGGNGIASGATVTVVFRQAAGITNSRENDLLNLHVRVTNNGVDAGFSEAVRRRLFIPTHMLPSNNDGKRGRDFTLFASGIEGNESITFFRDSNGNGVREVIEPVLCTIVAVPEDTATCTFTISSPPFVPGEGADCDVNNIGTSFDCNFINFLDSEGRNTTGGIATLLSGGGDPLGKAQPLDQEAVNRQVFFLDQTITASSDKARVGKTLTISLFDWPKGVITRISIGGQNIKDADLPSETVPTSGEVSFNFTIPETLNNEIQLPLGKVPFKVFVTADEGPNANEDTNITISK